MLNSFSYSQIAKEVIPCPICNAQDFELVNQRDRYAMGVQTVQCLWCGFVFTNPRPTVEALDDFYLNHYRRFYESTPRPNAEYIEKGRFAERASWNFNFVADELNSLVKSDVGHILDIGCAEGSFLRLIKQKFGGMVNCHGVEPSSEFARFAREYSGAQVFVGNLDRFLDTSGRPEKFNFVNLSHVLEHVINPVGFLKKIRSILADGGRLCLEVPNILGEWGGIGMFHIAHINQFCPTSVNNALRLAGFRIMKQDLRGNEIHPWKMTFLCEKSGPEPIQKLNDAEIKNVRAEIFMRLGISRATKLQYRIKSRLFPMLRW